MEQGLEPGPSTSQMNALTICLLAILLSLNLSLSLPLPPRNSILDLENLPDKSFI